MVLAEAVKLIVALATPTADLFPTGTFDTIEQPGLLALVLILVISFMLGLALRLAILRRVGAVDENGLFKPAVVTSAEGDRQLAYLVEDHGDGKQLF